MTSKNRISLLTILSTMLLAASNFGCASGQSAAPPNTATAAPISVSVSPTTPQSVDQGQTVNFTATVANDSSNKGVTWTVSCSTAPCGTVSPAATASGTPTTYTAPSSVSANLSVTITATSVADSTKSAPGPVTVMALSVAVAPTTIQTVDQGQRVNLTATVENDSSNKGVAWAVTCATAPCGTVSPAATASGAPTTYTAPSSVAANLTVSVTATPVADSTKFTSVLVIAVPPPSVASTSLADGMVNTAYSHPLQAAGGIAPYTWIVAAGSSLPAGLSLNSNGTVSGTPSASGTSSFSVQVADSGKPSLVSIPASVSMSVAGGPLAFTTTLLPSVVAGRVYCTHFSVSSKLACPSFFATGGLGPYTWSITAGALPAGMALDSDGSISNSGGTLTTLGTFNFTVQVTDSEVQPMTATQALSFTVTSPLNGRYAFLFHGFDDPTSKQIAAVGSFNADGAGNITSGVEDVNGPGGPALNVPFTGTYTFNGGERGIFTIVTASGTKTYALAFGSFNSNGIATKGRFIEFDDTTGTSGERGSGIIRMQDATAFSQTSITGSYAFGFAGQDSAGGRFAEAGVFTADGAGNLNNGLDDVNDAGTMTNSASFTGSYTAPDTTTGRASVTTTAAAGTTHLSAYVVSASELLLMSTDAENSSGLQSGEALSQASTAMPFSNGSLNGGAVFYQTGVNSAAPATQSSVEIGRFSADGNGGLSVEFDQNDGGTITADQTVTGLTNSVAPSGRVSISGGSQPILYLVDVNKGFYLDTGASVGFGFLEPQSLPANPFANCSGSTSGFGSFFIFYGSCFFGTAPPAVTASTVSSGGASVSVLLSGSPLHPKVTTTVFLGGDSSSSNGTLGGAGGVFAHFSFAVSSPGRFTGASGAIGYVVSPGNFVLIDETATDTAPVVTISEN